MTTHRFDGKVVSVTGAARGTGRQIALEFAKEGAEVILCDVNAEEGAAVLEEVRAAGSANATFIEADVSKASDVAGFFAKVASTYGRLDIAVNNAGVLGDAAPLDQQTEESFDFITGVNLRGVFLCLREEVAIMRPQRAGVIVNIASVASHISFPGLSIYTASKHAVLGMTKVAAQEFIAEGIRVSAVSPGVIDTPMLDELMNHDEEAKAAFGATTPLGRPCTPLEIARGVLFVASDDATLMVGQTLNVDGGWAFVKP